MVKAARGMAFDNHVFALIFIKLLGYPIEWR